MTRRTALTAIVAALVYAAMWIGYLQDWAWLTAIDNWFLDSFHAIGVAHPAWVSSWNVFCTVFGPTAFRLYALAFIVWLLARRYLRAALFLVISVELAGLVSEVAKYLVNRPRPATAMVSAPSSSFPSGHAVGVMVGVLALLTVALPLLAPRWRRPLIVLGAVIVFAIGLGRVVLNVHHPSDVVAGWALGYLYYLACLLMLRPTPLTAVRPAAGTPAAPGRAT
jgi:membrane-associated phospholipid phosphatase